MEDVDVLGRFTGELFRVLGDLKTIAKSVLYAVAKAVLVFVATVLVSKAIVLAYVVSENPEPDVITALFSLAMVFSLITTAGYFVFEVSRVLSRNWR